MNRIYIIGQTRTTSSVELFFLHRKLENGFTQWVNKIHSVTETLSATKTWMNGNKNMNFKLEIIYE